jgi:hypothetical protein
MDQIRKLLDLDQWPDLEASMSGFQARKRVDIAPFAYEIQINAPLEGHFLNEVVKFALPALPEATRKIYSLCNGCNIGASKFFIYGNAFERISDRLRYQPYDLQNANLYDRPSHIDPDYLIIGGSKESSCDDDEALSHHHTLDCFGWIRVMGNSKLAVREYETVEEWLQTEASRALADHEIW